ncbi:MAG: hypothetical protein L6420_05675 [Elusimicrobia bacterium]|nr:hypothetical protein [Elusimicrobiota bacterium]
MALSTPKGDRNGEYKAYLKEIFEDVYSTNFKAMLPPMAGRDQFKS